MSDEVQKIILTDLKEIKGELKDLRKDLNSFKLKVIGFFSIVIAGAEILKAYLKGTQL